MNEALQTELAEILKVSKNGVVEAVELSKQGILKLVEIAKVELPELIEQIIRWEFVTSLIGCIMIVLLMASSFIITHKIAMHLKKKDDTTWGLPYMANLILIPLIAGVLTNLTWLKILVAPNLFLIEYFTNLIK